ncbi:YfiR family protein [Silanimonas lenta]|uniref:YfiR family protein n=1 Tax=Silanimonas lenta TaxID=265429 RepID=UPI0004278656|nr:YfiR family protein [Silanimonas lenta]
MSTAPGQRHHRPAAGLAGLLLALLAALGPPPSRAETGAVDEYALRAAFLFHFTRFVQWPDAAFESPDSPFRICVLGSDPFGRHLDALEERRAGGRPIQVRRTGSPAGLAGCQIAYIAPDAQPAWRAAGGPALDARLLTVASEGRFAREGGMMALVASGRRIQLHVNLASLQGSELRVSAKLLEIAEVRHGRPGVRG